ncbi:MAG: hypothetical protein LBS45_03860 [Synergistaceae bacterium]|nr:hypothetical protein [Synergistaceae bacterium]
MVFLVLLTLPIAAAGSSPQTALAEPSLDFDAGSIFKGGYRKLDDERYKPIGNPYLVWESFGGKSGAPRLMIVCGRVLDRKGAPEELKDIRLLLVREADSKLELLQRFKLGDGASPQILPTGYDLRDIGGGSDFMVRVARRDNNTEAYVYSFDKGACKLSETLRVGRSFPGKFGVKVSGTLEQGGFALISSVGPDKEERVDLSYAIDALIEDGIYQLNARPIPSMRSLSCVRAGYEGEEFIAGKDGAEVRVGMTLLTPSRKQIIDVTAVLTKDEPGKWRLTDYLFEPFLPYRL